MTKYTFKNISFLGVLNWVTIHSQTDKYVEIISTPCDGKVKHAKIFQIALKGKGRNLSHPTGVGVGGMGNYGEGMDFFISL